MNKYNKKRTRDSKHLVVPDLSYHNDSQETIDFRALASSVDGVILREGYRKTIDKSFIRFVSGCLEYEIPIVGVYHFLYPLNADDAIYEAISCVQNVSKAGLDPNKIFIFADYEYDTILKAALEGITLSKEDCNIFTEAFCAGISKSGYKPGIYTNIDFYKNYYIDDLKNKYPIWLADYSNDADFPCMIQQVSNKEKIKGVKGNVDLNYWYIDEISDESKTSASKVIALANEWLGKNEADGSYKEIIDTYNSYKGTLPRGLKMQYGWSWCACFWSALAIKLGYTDVMPIEISCGELVKRAISMNCWIESDSHIPVPGDAVLYDWQDSGVNDNVGWPDHVGLVDYVNREAGYFTTIEGNYNDTVKKRTVSLNGKTIRGFIHPKYDDVDIINGPITSNKNVDQVAHEVIAGQWGSGDERKRLLESNGYSYTEVQKRVNEILNGSLTVPDDPNVDLQQPYNTRNTASCKPSAYKIDYYGLYTANANLYLRNDAGKNKKALAIIPKGTTVRCGGHYSTYNNVPWLYVNFIMNGTYYGGFSSSKYLVKS